MELVVRADEQAAAARAADLVCRLVRRRPNAHLCLAAGGSPRPLYAELVRRAREGAVSFADVRVTKLDEWCGLPLDHPATCEQDLRAHLLVPLDLRPEQYLAFDGTADPEAEARRVAAELVRRGPFDMSVLGLGLNGHLGMNEPAEELEPHLHVATLSEDSRHHSLLRELAEPPTHGLTMGIADLMLSREVVLLVTGERKQAALARLLTGTVSTGFPASLLTLHCRCWCVADRAAVALARPVLTARAR